MSIDFLQLGWNQWNEKEVKDYDTPGWSAERRDFCQGGSPCESASGSPADRKRKRSLKGKVLST